MRLAANFGVRLLRAVVSGSALFAAKQVVPLAFELSSITEVGGLSQRFKRHSKVKVSPIYRCAAENREGRTESNSFIQNIKHCLNPKWHQSANSRRLLLGTS